MPARKPRRMKLLNGTIQPCRDRAELELAPVQGPPEAPGFLDVAAADEFDRVANLLHCAGVLTQADFSLLVTYAAAWGNLVKLWTGGIRPTPADLTAFRQLATELGLSPRSRASLPPSTHQMSTNPFSEIGHRLLANGGRRP